MGTAGFVYDRTNTTLLSQQVIQGQSILLTTLASELKEVESLFRALSVVMARLSKVLVRFSRVTS